MSWSKPCVPLRPAICGYFNRLLANPGSCPGLAWFAPLVLERHHILKVRARYGVDIEYVMPLRH